MNEVFGSIYSGAYDELYRDKDYVAEGDFLERLFKKHSDIAVKCILDLGCGAGGHALLFAKRGYQVTGLDRSSTMLDCARLKARKSGVSIDWHKGDVRRFDLGRQYDVVIAMFAVMGYQTETEDFLNALKCVKKHLKPGGIFISDVWFGPAVLAQRPEDKVKIVGNGEEKIVRISHSVLDIRKNTVNVNFNLMRIRGNLIVEQAEEIHLVRFFFLPEIDYLSKVSGFKTIITYPFMSEESNITEKDWNLCIVLK